MLKKITLPILFLTLCLIMSCSGEKEAGNSGAVNPTAEATPASANITYGAGVFDLEKGPEGSWRWVGDQGSIKLKNNKTDMRLKIAGTAPIDLIGQSSEVTIRFNGEQLDQVTLTKEKNSLEKEYNLSAAQQANGDFSELTISSSKSFIPKQAYKNSSDDRKLSFSLTKLEWEAKP